MITRDIIEPAYCFFHQKQRIYEHSTLDWQRDDIECAIAAYVEAMSPELYDVISQGKTDFLCSHRHFPQHIRQAVERLEKML